MRKYWNKLTNSGKEFEKERNWHKVSSVMTDIVGSVCK